MIKSDFDNMLRREALSLAELGNHLLNEGVENDGNYGGLRLALSTPDLCSPRKVILTGCGDSYCAGVAAERAFKLLGRGVNAEAMPIAEYTRNYPADAIGTEPNNPMVYIVSASGGPSRCFEAAKRTNDVNLGGLSVAVTGNAESPLGKECKRTLLVPTPPLENVFGEAIPGCRSYYSSMFALFSSAIRMGEVKGVYPMSDASDMRKNMVEFPAAVEAEAERIDQQMFELAEAWKDFEAFECFADGSDMATAWFCAAKIAEATGDFATYENVEEFGHINYFAKDPATTPAIFFANYNDPAYVRYKRSIDASVKLGRPTLVITDAPESDFIEGAIVCRIPSPKYYWQMPLAQHVPFDLLAGYLAKLKGVAMFRRDLPELFQPGNNKLRNSQIDIVK